MSNMEGRDKEVFNKIKEANDKDPVFLMTDASAFGIGEGLVVDEEKHPIAFDSQALTTTVVR